MKFLSWNIGGAHIFSGNTEGAPKYEREDLDYFISQIKQSKPENSYITRISCVSYR
jgi:hypothetical protein